MWQEPEDKPQSFVASMVDALFRIDCAALPVDHAAALSAAVCHLSPWLAQNANAGVHAIHVAGSQNGWERPDADGQELLILSKRTKLKIRVPSIQAKDIIHQLSGQTLSLDGHTLRIVSGRSKAIEPTSTLFSRYTWFDQSTAEDETRFVQRVIVDCQSNGFNPSKVLCGRSNRVAYHNKQLLTRSVLLADVPAEHSIRLQETGLGSLRLMGCGLLIPHKDTGAVTSQ